MTSPKSEGNIGGKISKLNKYFIWNFIAILFEVEKYALFKIAILGQKNVRFVLNILFRQRKLFLGFLDFFIFI